MTTQITAAEETILFHPPRMGVKLSRKCTIPCWDFFVKKLYMICCGWRGGLMISELDPGASGMGSSPGQGRCVVFLGKTLDGS